METAEKVLEACRAAAEGGGSVVGLDAFRSALGRLSLSFGTPEADEIMLHVKVGDDGTVDFAGLAAAVEAQRRAAEALRSPRPPSQGLLERQYNFEKETRRVRPAPPRCAPVFAARTD